MNDWPDMIAACAWAVFIWGGAAWAAWRVAARVFGRESPVVRIVAAGVVQIAIIVLTLECLGAAGALRPMPAALAVAAIVALAARLKVPATLRADAAALVDGLRRAVNGGWAVLLCLAGVLAAQALRRGLLSPPLSWDSLTFHAFLPGRWVHLGEISRFSSPGGMDTWRAYPVNFELLVAWVMLPFHGDLLINLINLPTLALLGAVGYAICGELGAGRRLRIIAGVFTCFSPPLWALSTTQYSDILSTAVILAAVLFLLRYRRGSATVDLLFAAGAAGLAAGTRYAALPFCGLILSAGFVLAARNRRLRWIVPCLAAGAALGGWQYARNWIDLGNPVYPNEVRIGSAVVFPGSPRVVAVLEQYPEGDRADDWRHVLTVLSPAPLSWGPKYVVLGALAVTGLFVADRYRRLRVHLALFVLAGFVLFYLPGGGLMAHVRRCWPETSQRMLAVAMCLMACLAVGAPWAERVPRQVLIALTTAAVAFDAWVGAFPQPLSPAGAGVVALVVIAGLWISSKVDVPRWMRIVRPGFGRRAAIAVVLFGGFVVFSGALDRLRQERRYAYFEKQVDYHDIPRDFVAGWRACDEPAAPHTVAAAWKHAPDARHSIVTSGTRWMVYPLLGSRLQNTVVHASFREEADHPSAAYLGELSDAADRRTWLRNLRRLGADRFFLGDEAPPEASWIDGHPAVFREIARGPACRVFEIIPEALAAAIEMSDARHVVAFDTDCR